MRCAVKRLRLDWPDRAGGWGVVVWEGVRFVSGFWGLTGGSMRLISWWSLVTAGAWTPGLASVKNRSRAGAKRRAPVEAFVSAAAAGDFAGAESIASRFLEDARSRTDV